MKSCFILFTLPSPDATRLGTQALMNELLRSTPDTSYARECHKVASFRDPSPPQPCNHTHERRLSFKFLPGLKIVNHFKTGAGRKQLLPSFLLLPLITQLWQVSKRPLGVRKRGEVNFTSVLAAPVILYAVLGYTDRSRSLCF